MNKQRIKEIYGFAPGDPVRIVNLTNATHLNDAMGIVGQYFDANSGRYEVKLDPPFQKTVKVKALNLSMSYCVNGSITAETWERIHRVKTLNATATHTLLQESQLNELNQIREEQYQLLNHPEIKRLNINLPCSARVRILQGYGLLDLPTVTYATLRTMTLDVLEETTCPHIEIEAICQLAHNMESYNDLNPEEYEEVKYMLEDKLDTHHGHLVNIVTNLATIMTNLNQYEEAFAMFDTYIPLAESFPLKDGLLPMKVRYATIYKAFLRTTADCDMSDEMITKAKYLIDQAKNEYQNSTTRSEVLEAELMLIEAQIMVQHIHFQFFHREQPFNPQYCESALRLHEHSARSLLRIFGEQSGQISTNYEGIAWCCYYLGDAKNAQKFLKKSIRGEKLRGMEGNEVGNERYLQTFETSEHRRDLIITLTDSQCCNPNCSKVMRMPKLCARCKAVRYCSRTCQKAHYKIHKKVCQKK